MISVLLLEVLDKDGKDAKEPGGGDVDVDLSLTELGDGGEDDCGSGVNSEEMSRSCGFNLWIAEKWVLKL